MSILTCACIGVMHIWALYWNLGTYVVVPVHINHKVCIIRWSSDWWAGMRSMFIVKWCCFMTMLSSSAATICSIFSWWCNMRQIPLLLHDTWHEDLVTAVHSESAYVPKYSAQMCRKSMQAQLCAWCAVVQFWLQSMCILASMDSIAPECSIFQFLCLRPWFAKNAMQIIQLDTYGVGLIDQHPQTSFWAHILRIWQ